MAYIAFGSACVMPKHIICYYVLFSYPECITECGLLKHPLRLVGKSYGGGAIKVEPRALERLPLPPDVVAEVGLVAVKRRYSQMSFGVGWGLPT